MDQSIREKLKLRSLRRLFNFRSSAVLLTFLVALNSPSVYPIEKVEFRLIDGYGIVVPVYINESGPYNFLLDTGSNVSIVSREVLKKVDLSRLDNVDLLTPSGRGAYSTCLVEALRLGQKTVRSMKLLVGGLPELSHIKLQGLIGQDFFARFDYVIDYQNRHLLFEEREEFSECLSNTTDVYDIQRYANRMIVMIPPQTVKDRPALVVLDSGSGCLVLFGTRFRELGLDFDLNSLRPQPVLTPLGHGAGITGRVRELRLKSIRMGDQDVLFQEDPNVDLQRIEDGLLPTRWFRSVYVNNTQNLVVLNPKLPAPAR